MATLRSDHALDVRCPKCSAEPGDACRTSVGALARSVHAARRSATGIVSVYAERRASAAERDRQAGRNDWSEGTRAHFRDADELPINVDPAARLGKAGEVQGSGTQAAANPVDSAGYLVKIPTARRRIRMLRTNAARRALAPFLDAVERDPDTSDGAWWHFWRTTGDFSLLDAILVLLDAAGPSRVTVETWSAGLYDMEVLNRFVASEQITSFRLVLDVSFRNNKGNNAKDGTSYAAVLEDVFGLDAIRTTRTHDKNVTVTGGRYDFALWGSPNLNENRRAENLNITNDPGMVAFRQRVADELFDGIEPGWHPDRGADQLGRVDATGDTLGAQPMTDVGVMDL